MRRVGFAFSERMVGTWRPAAAPDAPPRPLVLRARVEARDVLAHLATGRSRLEGQIDMEGVASARPIHGFLELAPLARQIRYEFAFTADEGPRLRFTGAKDVRLLALRRTMTRLPATIVGPDGEVFGRAELAFDLGRELVPMLRSLSVIRS